MITTFKNHGKLRIPITSLPVNQADKDAAYLISSGIIPQDGTIKGDLYDADDNLITRGRVYSYDGIKPFTDLNEGQKGYLSGKEPETKWNTPEIKLWLSDRQKKDVEGQVVKDDPYSFKELDTKEVLLSRIEVKEVEPITLDEQTTK